MLSRYRVIAVLVFSPIACAPRAPTPPPVPRPTSTAPPPPAATPLPVAPTSSRAFRYSGGEHRYALTTDATVSVQADSIRPPLESQTTTRTIYSLSIDTAAQPPRIVGSIDSFTVRRGSRIPLAADSTLRLPLHWTSALGANPSTPTPCSIGTELIAGAQDLLPRLPTNLEDGHRWQEEVTRSVCRADIPVTVSTVHEYRVAGLALFENDTALQITRTTTAKLEGERHQDDKTISLRGTGSGAAQLYLDPVAGRLIGRIEQSRTDLIIETPRGRTRLSQDVRSQLTREP